MSTPLPRRDPTASRAPAPADEDVRPSPFGPLPAREMGDAREVLLAIHGRLGWILLVLVLHLLGTCWLAVP